MFSTSGIEGGGGGEKDVYSNTTIQQTAASGNLTVLWGMHSPCSSYCVRLLRAILSSFLGYP